MNLFGHFADQLVDIQSGEHGVSDSNQNAKVVALVAQQIVIDVIADPALDLLSHHRNQLGKRMQSLELFLAPRSGVVTDKLAAAKDAAFRRQRQQAVIAKRWIESAAGQLRPGLDKGLFVAVQRIGTRQQATHRPVRQYGLIFVADRQARFVTAVPCRTMVPGVPQNNRRPIRQRGLLHQAGQRFTQRRQIGLL